MPHQTWQYCLISGGYIIEFFDPSGIIRIYDLLRIKTDKKDKTYYVLVTSDDKIKFHPFESCLALLGAEGWEVVQVGSGPGNRFNQEPQYGIWPTIQECPQVHWALFKRPLLAENRAQPPSFGPDYLWAERDDKTKPHYR